MSSQNGGRSPKDLRRLLSAARQDDSFFPQEIEVNLAKLKSLSKDELSENSMLRDRIDQQSELICILKRQADSSLNKTLALEKEVKNLQNTEEEAVCNYHDQIRKYNVLEKRFEILYHNHEEIIKIKDEYKVVNNELRRENEELLNKKKQNEAAVIQEKNNVIVNLKEELVKLKNNCEKSEEQLRSLKEQQIASGKQSREIIESLNKKVNNAEKSVQESEEKVKSISSELLSTQKVAKMLQKEKENWEQAALDQKQTCFEQNQKITELRLKVKELELSLKRQSDQFAKEIESVSADAQVRKLKTAFKKAEEKIRNHDKEFQAYRMHTEKLLSKERELNSQLRQLIG